VYLIQLSLLLIAQQNLVDFLLAGGLSKFCANAGGKQPIQRQPLLVQYKHQANLLLSMNNFTPLVISRNDKISSYKLLSQSKLALTAINKLFAY
jgi:hypothetical protein